MVGCKAGPRSLQAAALLGAAGYTNVVDMQGGFHGERDAMGRVTCAGWAEQNLPVEETATRPTHLRRAGQKPRRSRSARLQASGSRREASCVTGVSRFVRVQANPLQALIDFLL